METSGMSETLLRDGSYTVLAPTNMAFSYLNQWRLDEMLNDPERVKKVKRLVCEHCEHCEHNQY